MHLIYSTSDYSLPGTSRAGFPILLREDMSSFREANEFLRQYLMQGTICEGSWETIGRAIYDYLSFLESNDLDWRDVNRGELKSLPAAYRDYCGEVFGHKRNTIRLRLTYIFQFYEYALRQKWISRLPYTSRERRGFHSQGFFAHLNTAGTTIEVPSVMPRYHKTVLRFLSIEESRQLLAETKNIHHYSVINFFLRSGIRRTEMASFPLSYIFDPDVSGGNSRNVRILLDPQDGSGMKTKGSKARMIWIPRNVMRELYSYSRHYRGERSNLTENQHLQLFLNQDGEPFADNGAALEEIVRSAGQRIGVHAHPHKLRHTYATHTLSLLQRAKRKTGIEPLVFLQGQLGHESIEQTRKYAHLVNQLADDAVLDYDSELNSVGG